MSILLFFKTKLYRILQSELGKSFLSATSRFVKVGDLGNDGKKNFPFHIALTVDTESGYVGKGEYRHWQYNEPDSFQGFTYGLQNLGKIAAKHKVPFTFLLSTQCFSAKGEERRRIVKEVRGLSERHEIGYHLHPTTDATLQRKLGKKLGYNSAKFYSRIEKVEMLRAGKKIIEEELGKKVISFRWGNFGMDENSAQALTEAGFKVDCSATPGMKGHLKDDRCYDWSRIRNHYSWKMGKILEIPIATFSYFGIRMVADPVYLDLLPYAFDVYYANASREKKPFTFVVVTHSCEATDVSGKQTKVVETLDRFIDYAKRHRDVKFVTIKQASGNVK